MVPPTLAHTLSVVTVQAAIVESAQDEHGVHTLTPTVSALNDPTAHEEHTVDVTAVSTLP